MDLECSNYVKYTVDPRLVIIIESFLDKTIPNNIIVSMQKIARSININNIYQNLLEPIEKSAFVFYNNAYTYYKLHGKYYVDLYHIVGCICQSKDEYYKTLRMYTQYISNTIWDFRFDKNITMRYLIDLNTMGRIVLSSNSYFKKIFIIECTIYLFLLLVYIYYYKNNY